MYGEIDQLPFYLAEKLGKSLTEIDQLPYPEIVMWRAKLKYDYEMEKYGQSRK